MAKQPGDRVYGPRCRSLTKLLVERVQGSVAQRYLKINYHPKHAWKAEVTVDNSAERLPQRTYRINESNPTNYNLRAKPR